MSVVVISNPRSGAAAAGVVERTRGILAALGDVTVVEPSSVDSFDEEVAAACAASSLVVVVGGDGTLNCAINALDGRLSDVAIGIVPAGTGNDLARTLGIPGEPEDAARAIVDGHDRDIDVGRASADGASRLFVNACMGGFPVDVDEAIDGDIKARLGPAAFWVGGLKAVGDLTRFRAAVDGQVIEECVAVGVGNGRTAGGGIEVFPGADPADGTLDACALPAANAVEAVRLAAKVKAGSHQELPRVSRFRGSRLTVAAEPRIEFNVDGELAGIVTPVTFELADRVRVRVP